MWIPEKQKDGLRRYGRCARNPMGYYEDTTRCAFEVADDVRSPMYWQCARKRGHGPDGEFCKQHAKKVEKL